MPRLLMAAALGLAAVTAAGGRGQVGQPPPNPYAAPQVQPGFQGQPGFDPTPQGTEVLARGPVHECFAEPVDGKLNPTPVVRKPPPPPIEELPPDQRPEGNVEWVAGYWHWDDDRNDYIWVSGCWRDDPPGKDWLPGRWEQVQGGYHWVSGCWVPEGQENVQLLPQPPAPIEEERDQVAPDQNSKFVPGTWIWKETKYVWRPGKWIQEPADWVYQPANYIWSPGGYIFTDGYWDKPLRGRGLLFAPCAFPNQVVATQKVTFEPQYAVQPDFLEGAMFVRAETKHYYFGDFFENRYKQAGYIPWTEYQTGRVAIDPLFAHYKIHRPAPNWEQRVRTLYTARYAGQAPRPPRTLVAQQQFVRTTVRQRVDLTAPPPQEFRQVVALAPVAPLPQAQTFGVQTFGVRTTKVVQEQRVQYRQFAQQRVQVAAGYQEQAFRRIKQEHSGNVFVPQQPYSVKIKTVTRTRIQGAGPPVRLQAPPPPQFQFDPRR